jgi:hypothetical protein
MLRIPLLQTGAIIAILLVHRYTSLYQQFTTSEQDSPEHLCSSFPFPSDFLLLSLAILRSGMLKDAPKGVG